MSKYAMAESWAHKLYDYERRDDHDWSLAALRGIVQHPILGRCFIGSFVAGMGFIDVLFPEDAVRPCTKTELEYYTTVVVVSSFRPRYRLPSDAFASLADLAALPGEDFKD